MLKTNVGQSIDIDGFKSGAESATKASKKITEPKIGVLATSVMYDQQDVYKGIKSVLGNVPIIGMTSTGGIMTPEGIISSEKGFSGLMLFEDENLTVGVAGKEKDTDDVREIGRQIAKEAMKNAGKKTSPNYFMMIASPKDEESYLNGIQDVIGRVPMFGGSAADEAINGDWRIICNNKDFSEGCAVAFFYTESALEVEFTGSYEETGEVGVLTEVDGKRHLLEIDGVPALKKIANWLNSNPDDLMGTNLLLASCSNPIGVKDPTGTIRLTRLPWIGCPDYSIRIGNDMAAGTALFALRASQEDLIDSSKQTIADVVTKLGTKAKGYLLFHSISRKFAAGDKLSQVYEDIKEQCGNKPFLVIFSFGEYGYREHSANYCATGMLTYVGFGK